MIECALQRALVQHGRSRNHRVRVLRQSFGEQAKVRQETADRWDYSDHGLLRDVNIDTAREGPSKCGFVSSHVNNTWNSKRAKWFHSGSMGGLTLVKYFESP